MPRDQFKDLGRYRDFVLALAPRFGESLRTSTSNAALLEEAFQVGQCFNLLHIITHYLRVCVDFGMIHTLSRRRRLNPMGWMQFLPSPLRIINCSKNIIRNRLSARAVHQSPERTQCGTALGGPCLPCSWTRRAGRSSIESITTGIGYGPGAWNGLSISTWTGQRTNITSFNLNVTLRQSCISPRKHVRGNMIRSTFPILMSNLRQHAGPCGRDHSVD